MAFLLYLTMGIRKITPFSKNNVFVHCKKRDMKYFYKILDISL
jgi:hypothetical protein